MAQINVRIIDHTGSKSYDVELPDNVPVERLLETLITKLNLPTQAPSGEPQVYHLVDKTRGNVNINGKHTLREAGVTDGSTLRLVPEVVPGCKNERLTI